MQQGGGGGLVSMAALGAKAGGKAASTGSDHYQHRHQRLREGEAMAASMASAS